MRYFPLVGLVVLWPAIATAQGQEALGEQEAAGRAELVKMQGTWRFESWEEGKKAQAPLGKDRTFFVGGDFFMVRDGEKMLQAGTLRLSPGKKPQAIDALVRKGAHEGKTLLGIYEAKGDTLRVCFDTEGDNRPKEFKADKESARFVAVCKRVTPPGEDLDITGLYESASVVAEGKKLILQAEIARFGDAYIISWTKMGMVAYLGVGIRKGNILSVSSSSQGNIGISVYEIKPGPKLFGIYTELRGPGIIAREELTWLRKKDDGQD